MCYTDSSGGDNMKRWFDCFISILLICIAYFVTCEKRLYRIQNDTERKLAEVYKIRVDNEKEIRLLKQDVKKLEEIVYGGDYD